jgi:hypothetical protein
MQRGEPLNATRVWTHHERTLLDEDPFLEFIADHINTLPDSEKREKWKYWVDIFGKACQTEKAFLDLAYEDLKYDVISDGRYKIRTYGNDGLYLVPDAGGRVMAQQDDPDENQTVRDSTTIHMPATKLIRLTLTVGTDER